MNTRIAGKTPDGEVTVRAAADGDDDQELLFEIYASTRRDEVAGFGWTEEQQRAFLRMQFDSRNAAYKLQFPSAETMIILAKRKPVGSLIVERRADVVHVADIAVLPHLTRQGIGGAVIEMLKRETASANKALVLSVDHSNDKARQFYLDLGFRITGERPTHQLLEWRGAAD